MDPRPKEMVENCVATLVRLGWKQLKGDRCVFILMEDDQLVAIAGLHVDDFLVAGSQTSQKFLESGQELLKAFRWGKWESGEFEFAGCELKQLPDNSIILSQEKYTDRWMEEITIDKPRLRKAVLTPEETSALCGALQLFHGDRRRAPHSFLQKQACYSPRSTRALWRPSTR